MTTSLIVMMETEIESCFKKYYLIEDKYVSFFKVCNMKRMKTRLPLANIFLLFSLGFVC